MTESIPDEIVEMVKSVNDIVVTLDPHVRAAAFSYLLEHASLHSQSDRTRGSDAGASSNGREDAADFFGSRAGGTPAENVVTIAAFHYATKGNGPFSVDDIRSQAAATGLTVPGRIDMTLVSAKRDGRSLFRRSGKGLFAPTVHGEGHFRTYYRVTPALAHS